MVLGRRREDVNMYQILNDDFILRIADNLYIPRYAENVQFQEFLAWEAAGGVAQPADPAPAYVPAEVPAVQFYAALMADGLYDDVQGWAADPQTSALHRLAFEKGTTFQRDSQALAAVAEVLGWSPKRLDQLFISAEAIKL
jgi:hypothetical protein